MTVEAIEKDFKKKVSELLRLKAEGLDRYRVFTPFLFEDGDHLAIVLKRNQDRWLLTDEGHTYMHLTYDLDEKDLRSGTRQKIISNALTAFSVSDKYGELIIDISEDRYGDSLFNFIQALLKISDISFLSRDRVRSTFMEDFKNFIIENIQEKQRYTFDWFDQNHDPDGRYTVDCKINGMPNPVFIYALPSDDKVRDATIGLLKYECWNINFRSIGIFEDQEEISRKVLARFSDICDKQYSSLSSNKDRISKYLSDCMLTK
jgi:hypothetical protein